MQEEFVVKPSIKPSEIPEQKPGLAGGKRDLNRRQKTDQIGQEALELFLAQGVESVTIDEIVGAAQIAKGSFYRYFKDKEALEAMNRCGENVAQAEDLDVQKGAYLELAENLAGIIFASPDSLRLYLQEKRGPLEGAARPIRQLAQEIGQAALEITQRAHAKGLLKPIPAQVSTLVVVGAVEELLFQMLSGTVVENWMEMPAAVADLIFYGLRKED